MAHKLSASVRSARAKPGGSNVGNYPNVKSFAGPSGELPDQYPCEGKIGVAVGA